MCKQDQNNTGFISRICEKFWALIPDLHKIGGESPIQPNPVTRWDYADASHTAEDAHSQLPPVIAEVMRVDLSAEDCQDQRQNSHQVDLPPKLRGTNHKNAIDQIRLNKQHGALANNKQNTKHNNPEDVHAYCVTVEGVEDPGNVTAQDAN